MREFQCGEIWTSKAHISVVWCKKALVNIFQVNIFCIGFSEQSVKVPYFVASVYSCFTSGSSDWAPPRETSVIWVLKFHTDYVFLTRIRSNEYSRRCFSRGARSEVPDVKQLYPQATYFGKIISFLMSWLQDSIGNLINGHLVKADTSLKRTRGVGPCRTSVIYFISLQGGHLSKADSRSWSRALEGVDCIHIPFKKDCVSLNGV